MRIWLLLCTFFILASPCHAIKIGLQTGVDNTAVGTSVKGVIIDANTNKQICNLEAMKGYALRPYNDTIAIKIDGNFYKLKSDSIIIKPSTSGFTSTKSRWYRGHLIVQNKNGKLTVINDVELEDYIKGVVPSEMSPSWHEEALKAQAIAARSYALANIGKRSALGFDLFDTPDDQAYRGASAETAKTNNLVDSTKGIVLTHDMKVVNAYYSASAGGQSLNSKDVWGGSLPYIHSVPSYDGNVKKMGHGVGMSQHGANNLAKGGKSAFQILQYFYNDVKFAKIKQNNG
jgi:stage II sporulation protein D